MYPIPVDNTLSSPKYSSLKLVNSGRELISVFLSKYSSVKLVKFESAVISDMLLPSNFSSIKLVKFESALISDISFAFKFSVVKLVTEVTQG